MSSIYLPTISSPSLEGAALAGKLSPAAFPFSVGEVYEAVITEKAGATKFLLTMKNYRFLADSELPLKAGEKLLVRVEHLNPQIVLRIANREASPASLIIDYIRFNRANPEALTNIFRKSGERFLPLLKDSPLPEAARSNIRHILRIIESLIFSPETAANPLFLKDYVSNLGLLLENSLLKLTRERRSGESQGGMETLKGALIKLADELNVLINEGDPAGLKLTQLAKFIETSVKAIEAQQVMNILYRDTDGVNMLQIPLLFPEGIKMGEIFIESEGKGKGEEGEKNRFHVVMFLSMDTLGDMMVDVTVADAKIGCLFKVADRETQDFLSLDLEGLDEALRLLGYDPDYLTCMIEKNVNKAREERRSGLLHDFDAVNLFA